MQVRRWLAVLVTVTMLTGLFGQAALAQGSSDNISVDEAVSFLQKVGIVQGDSGGLRLADPITRAELVKIVVVALGREREATILQGARAFSDTGDHWASGYIAVAKNLGLAGGYPDGSFQPQNNVTNAEAIAFISRAAGVEATPGLAWPDNVMRAAEEAAIIPSGLDLSAVANSPATRGGVFLLGHRGFKLVEGSDGKNVYQRGLDSEPPVLSVNNVPSTTTLSEVTVSGTVTGAESLTVNGKQVAVSSDGSFTVTVTLTAGQNEVSVVATDQVGNTAKRTLSVARVAGEAAAISGPSALNLDAGEEATLDIVVRDANGLQIPDPEVTAQISGEIGTLDTDTMTFTASQTPGSGSLTLKAGSTTLKIPVTVGAGAVAEVKVTADKESAAAGEQVNVSAKAYDQYGNEIKGLPVIYSVQGAGALINSKTGAFIGAQEGLYTVLATMGTTQGSINIGVYGDPEDLQIDGPDEVVGNGKGTVPFTVRVVDKNGSLVANDEDRTVELESDANQIEFVDENGTALAGDQLTLENGKGTFYIKAIEDAWGVEAEITATDTNDSDFEDTISVSILEQEPAAVAIKSQDDYLAANDDNGEATIDFIIVDQTGVEMLDGSWDIDWELDGPAEEQDTGAESGTVTFTAGVEPGRLTLQSIAGATGSIEVTATAEDFNPVTAKLTAAVVGGADKVSVKVSATEHVVGADAGPDDDKGIEVTVAVTDSKGVPVVYDGDIVLEFSPGLKPSAGGASDDLREATDDSASNLTLEDPDNDGLYDKLTVEFDDERKRTFMITTTKSGEMTLSAQDSAKDLDKGTATVTFQAGKPTTAGFASDSTLVAITDLESEVVVQVMDDYGNAVPQSGVSIEVQAEKGNVDTEEIIIAGKKGNNSVKTDENGKATVAFSVRPDLNADYSLTVEDAQGLSPDPDTGEIDVKVLPTAPDDINISFYVGASKRFSVDAGETFTLQVEVLDTYGSGVAGLDGFLHLDIPDGSFDADNDPPGESAEAIREAIENTWDDSDEEDGIYKVALTPAKKGKVRVTVKVTVGGQEVIGSGLLTINAGDADHVTIEEADDDGDVTITEGAITALKFVVVDEYDNQADSDSYTVQFDRGADDDNLVLRTSASSADIDDGDEVSMGNSKTLYVLGTRDGSYTLTISLQGGTDYSFDFTVRED